MKANFRSLGGFNYRIWAAGALVSYTGTWMQRVAQSWLVLTQLTHNNATAVGIVTALQLAPFFLAMPWTGSAADHLDRRKLLMVTQGLMGSLALGLGLLTISGMVEFWHVCVFAALLGCASAFDAPASHTFASELVGEANLSNAVALNSTAFNAARLIGPAIAGILISLIGSGWVFILNALSFATVILALRMLRLDELHRGHERKRPTGGFAEGLRYVRGRPDLQAVLLMIFLVGTFSMNFPLFISAMAVNALHAGAAEYGLLMSALGMGSVLGAISAAGPARLSMRHLFAGAALLSVGLVLAAAAPNHWLFAGALALVGAAAVTFTTSTSSFMQLECEANMRGRMIALRTAVTTGGAPIGAPLQGWIADALGPRSALLVAAAAAAVAMMVALRSGSRARRQTGA